MPSNGKYEVRLELFEGPLDLLLYLVNKAEVDITEIPVAQIAEQYLQYLDLMRELNIDLASEYLHMAATLVRLKARELLPPTEAEVFAEAEEGVYNKEQLIQQLLEYKKYKEAAFSLRRFEAQQAGSFPRGKAEEIEVDESDDQDSLGDVSIFDLLSAFQRVLEAEKVEQPSHVVRVDTVRIDDRIDHVLTVLGDREVPFEHLFVDDMRRIVLVVTFMALLELVKLQEIAFRQERQFGPILVCRRDPATRQPDIPAGETTSQ